MSALEKPWISSTKPLFYQEAVDFWLVFLDPRHAIFSTVFEWRNPITINCNYISVKVWMRLYPFCAPKPILWFIWNTNANLSMEIKRGYPGRMVWNHMLSLCYYSSLLLTLSVADGPQEDPLHLLIIFGTWRLQKRNKINKRNKREPSKGARGQLDNKTFMSELTKFFRIFRKK